MILVDKKEDCCGCFACENICPNNSIELKRDKEGFKYPKVNKNTCDNCDLCIQICPLLNNKTLRENLDYKKSFYACKNKNNIIREKSSSGGIFSLIAEEIIKKGGIVFGAVFNDNFLVEHRSVKNELSLEKIRKSKYLQSDINKTFREAENYLKENKLVLFSGVPCQIAGLKSYLKKDYNNLIAVDIACHGVSSPKVFEKYLKFKKSIEKKNIIDISFRNKQKGWRKFSFTIDFENGHHFSETLSENIYIKGFLRELYQRPACHSCKFKIDNYKSDITLADYWGIQMFHPKLDDDKGVSFVSINSKRGEEIFRNLYDKLDIEETKLEYAVKKNPCIVRYLKPNKNRNQFFKYLDYYPIDILIKLSLRKNKLSIKDHLFILKEKLKRILK